MIGSSVSLWLIALGLADLPLTDEIGGSLMGSCFRRVGLLLAYSQIIHLLKGALLSFSAAFLFWLYFSIF